MFSPSDSVHRSLTGRVSRLTRLLAFSIAVSALAGGSTAAAPLPDDLAALVPAETGALVYIPSPAELEAKLRAMVEQVSPENASKVAITGMLAQMLGPAGASWDTSRPMAVAAVPPAPGAGMMPSVTIILPTLDIAEARAAFGIEEGASHPLVSTEGSYLGFAMIPGASSGGGERAAILDASLDGDLAMRFDVDRIMAAYGPVVEQRFSAISDSMEAGMGEADSEGAQLGQMMSGFPQKIMGGLRAAERLDVTVGLDGVGAELGYALSVGEGTDLATSSDDPDGVRRVAGRLPADLPAVVWFAAVVESWMIPWDKGAPSADDADAEVVAYFETIEKLYDSFGPSAGAFGVDTGGIWLCGVSEPTVEPDELRATFSEYLRSDWLGRYQGVEIVEEGTTELEGVELHGVRMEIDVERLAADEDADAEGAEMSRDAMEMFFADGMWFRYGFVDDAMVYGLGGDAHLGQTIRAVQKGGRVPDALKQAFDRSELPPNYVLQCDLRAVAVQVVKLMRAHGKGELTDVPSGAPVPVTFWNGHADTRYRGGVEVDVAGVAELIGWLTPQMPKEEEETEPAPTD